MVLGSLITGVEILLRILAATLTGKQVPTQANKILNKLN